MAPDEVVVVKPISSINVSEAISLMTSFLRSLVIFLPSVVHRPPYRMSGANPWGAAGAGSHSPIEVGAPALKTQGHQLLSPFAEYPGPVSIFAPNA